MAKLSYSSVFLLMLLFSVLLVMPIAEAQKRCKKDLDPSKQCILSDCMEKCLKQLNGNGLCLERVPQSGNYVCACFFNCGGVQ